MVYGKVPPQAKDLEDAVLGAIMLEPSALDRVTDLLTAESFYVEAHQRIFRAMLNLQKKNQPIDILTVVEELKTTDELEMIGGPYYVTRLTNAVVSSASIEAHARYIQQKFIRREIIRISGEQISKAYDDKEDTETLLEDFEREVLEIGQRNNSEDMVSMDTALIKTVEKIEFWRKQDSDMTGKPTGFPMLNRATRGFQDGDLIILAARPSVGKTALALKIAATNAKDSIGVGIWNLEMDYIQQCLRLLASESETLLHRLQTGQLDDDQMSMLYKDGIQKLAKYKVYFNPKPTVTINEFCAKARRLKKKKDVGIILIDYLQLMSGSDKSNREQQIADISRRMKLLARELNIPIVALSQLSRDVEKRTGRKKMPQLSDLRESGAIEQDADVVLFLWAPDDEEIEQDALLQNRIYCRVAKQRNGMLLTVNLELDRSIQKFKQAEDNSLISQIPPSNYRPLTSGESKNLHGDNPF